MEAMPQREPIDLWHIVLERLSTMMGEDAVSRWFGKVRGVVETEASGTLLLRVAAPNTFHEGWLRSHYYEHLTAIWRALAPEGVVQLTVDTTLQPGQTSESTLPAQVLQLEWWDDSKHAGPNALFRSALFPALNYKQPRRYLDRERVFAVAGVEVIFTGKQFDQSDLDVYLELLHLAQPFPLGTSVRFAAHALLKAIGRSTGNANHKWLHEVLIRLCAGVVEVTDHTKRYFGHLVEGGMKDELTSHYDISLNPKLAVLFGFGMWATLDRTQRHALGRNGVAKALHAYYSTHAGAGPHRFETLAGIAGLTDKNPRKIRMKLKTAHEVLASDPIGFLAGYTIHGDTIEPIVRHTPGQNRHLVRRLVPARPRTKRPRRDKS